MTMRTRQLFILGIHQGWRSRELLVVQLLVCREVRGFVTYFCNIHCTPVSFVFLLHIDVLCFLAIQASSGGPSLYCMYKQQRDGCKFLIGCLANSTTVMSLTRPISFIAVPCGLLAKGQRVESIPSPWLSKQLSVTEVRLIFVPGVQIYIQA